ncbi:hypothetical protein RFI_10280 [Reticulomyxa filosa]|uniref:Uncharacterized protein n=1 Tax=Reticulomyxa filosa TaxID=46433 RepID=X6NLJ5_RETFI|nr:hypothetical protein RFI_10280 [Reticulomyxa filosa]|eukprot:ETO26856.1 hypothetical protein RFI_10280 [Reticulomyxa filosa]
MESQTYTPLVTKSEKKETVNRGWMWLTLLLAVVALVGWGVYFGGVFNHKSESNGMNLVAEFHSDRGQTCCDVAIATGCKAQSIVSFCGEFESLYMFSKLMNILDYE